MQEIQIKLYFFTGSGNPVGYVSSTDLISTGT